MSIDPQRTRRDVLKLAAWSTPIIAASIALPAAVASTPDPKPTRSRIAFTNATATEGAEANTVYVNTKIKVLDGPDQIENLSLVITVFAHGFERMKYYPWPALAGWDATELVKYAVPGVPKGELVTVTFHAAADGCAPISALVTVNPPAWWV